MSADEEVRGQEVGCQYVPAFSVTDTEAACRPESGSYLRTVLEEVVLCDDTVNRPPLAYRRLRQLDHGVLAFTLKTPWNNGTTNLVFTLLEFFGRLAALTPPPRLHLIRYHGVLAPPCR